MRILMVAPQPFFSPRGTPFSVYYRIQVICRLGHSVDLLTYGQGEEVDLPGCRVIRIPGFRALGPVPVGPSFLKLFLDCFMVLWTVGLLMANRYKTVYAHEEAVFWCRWLKPLFRFRLVYDMHSSLPQQLDNFQFTSLRPVHWLFEKLERSAVRAAEAVIVVCPALLDHARSIADDDGKILLIENSLTQPVKISGKDRATTAGNDTCDAAVERWINSRARGQVIAYAGTLEAYQGIDRLLAAFSVAAQQLPQAGLLIVGGMPQEVKKFRRLAAEMELGDSVYFAGQASHRRAQELVALAGASISVRLAGNNTPMKIYHLMAEGIPLIATRVESHTQVLNDDIAILTDATPDAIAQAMIRLLRDPEAARSMGARARAVYNTHYSTGAYAAKMRDALSMVA